MIHHHHRITPTIAITLALAASAAPVAWGDPQPLARAESAIANHAPASSGLCGDVCSGHGYGTVGVTTSAPASSGLCGDVCSGHGYGTVGATTSAPASSGLCGDVCSGHGYGTVGATTSPLGVRPHPAPAGGGFDWGDAGIGAGGMFAVTIIGLGGALAATNRRRRQPQHQQTSPNS